VRARERWPGTDEFASMVGTNYTKQVTEWLVTYGPVVIYVLIQASEFSHEYKVTFDPAGG
jgi:hypothetical protein